MVSRAIRTLNISVLKPRLVRCLLGTKSKSIANMEISSEAETENPISEDSAKGEENLERLEHCSQTTGSPGVNDTRTLSSSSPPPPMTKAQKKRFKKEKKKLFEKQKKREATARRIVDPAFDDQIKPCYFFENGLRKVLPYLFKYQTYARGRWLGREILDVIKSEFRYDIEENYATRLKCGLITVNGRPVSATYRLRNNDFMSSVVHRHELPVTAATIGIVRDDDDFLVVDKPASIPVHPCGRFRYNTITMILSNEMGYKNLRSIHRLDRATSGVLIFVKNISLTRELAAQVKNRELRKEYVCRVEGEFPVSDSPILVEAPLRYISSKLGFVRVDPVGGKPSRTSFKRLSFNGKSSVVKCVPESGRTHQIRVHLQYLGFPILNDSYYNCPEVWGSQNGRGGDCDGKTDEQLVEDASRLHSIDNYLDPQVFEELMEKKVNEVGENENRRSCGESNSASDTDKNQDLKNTDADTGLDASTSENEIPPPKKTRLNSTVEGEMEKGAERETPSDSTSCINTLVSSENPTFSKDYTCKDCLRPPTDPRPKDLVMFLHALRYAGPNFDFETPMPFWAKDDWAEDDDWKLR